MRIRIIIFLFLISVVSGWYLFGPGYYNMHDDLQVMRVYEMEKCLKDGQIPCRWTPDMAYGYGQAMFNFYSAFPYYLAAFLRLVTPFSIIGSVKLTFFLSIFLSAVGMYLLANRLWGSLGGIFSAFLYVFIPYHALDIFVRGALAESWAIAIIPFLWFTIYELIINPNLKNVLFNSIVISCFLTTHNIYTLISLPFTFFWAIFCLIRERKIKSFFYLLVSGILGFGLSSFFILPAIFEQSLVQIENLTQDYSDYHAHFVSLKQLFFERKWGDGPSIWGTEDDISFQVGWPHWWIVILTLFFTLVYSFKKRKYFKPFIIFFLFLFFLSSLFLTHFKSTFIWEKIPILSFVQFPWRFLGLSAFFLSLLSGALGWFKYRGRFLLIVFLMILTLLLNLSYFKPIHFSRLVKDEDKLKGLAFELQQKAAIVDYLPKTANIAPPAKAPETPNIIKGEGKIIGYEVNSDRFSFEAEMYTDGEIVVPVMYFPNWIVILDQKEYPLEIYGAHGLIKINLSHGKHLIRGRFTNTFIRYLGNSITLVSVLILLTGFVFVSAKKNEN